MEGLLLVAAAHGGPHGALGGWPWIAQFPGILLVLTGTGESQFLWRAGAGAVIQLVLWYLLIAYALKRLRERRSTASAAE